MKFTKGARMWRLNLGAQTFFGLRPTHRGGVFLPLGPDWTRGRGIATVPPPKPHLYCTLWASLERLL